jgi:tRNA(Ile)-lysidine synthetase-like protein
MQKSFQDSLAGIPEGQFAFGVSGGADSVGLLRLVMQYRPDIGVHVVHLNHELRAQESEGDAEFVKRLAEKHRLPLTIARRSELEPMLANRPANKSALYRAVRFLFFKKVVTEHALHGVLLAHQADDQAETVFHRLLRGSGPAGLVGMSPQSRQGMLSIWRPLLEHQGSEIRAYLKSIGQDWREDSSNRSEKYLRNRLRSLLNSAPQLSAPLIEVGDAMRAMKGWVSGNAPLLSERFAAAELAGWPTILAIEAARKWLISRGAPAGELRPKVLQRLVEFATDAAAGTRHEFPGKIQVRRRRGWLEAE